MTIQPVQTTHASRSRRIISALTAIVLSMFCGHSAAEHKCENVIVITLDGLRHQELFGGADSRLVTGAKSADRLKRQFLDESAAARRKKLMPFFWSTIAVKGQVWGDPSQDCRVSVTNKLNFSYPGYNEILSGIADPRIKSNDKNNNPNTTVLEWLHNKDEYRGQIAAFASWDVFPFIINQKRSEIYVNAGWQPLEHFRDPNQQRAVNKAAREVPKYWGNVRYDTFTFQGCYEYLLNKQPRVIYLALGETDDWAHDGRYDLYLDAAHQSDDHIRQLWEQIQTHPKYANKTAMIITTDHGRGSGREDWKSHGASIKGCELIWIAVIGPDTPATGVLKNRTATQSQVAASVAKLLGEDLKASIPKVAPALPGIVIDN